MTSGSHRCSRFCKSKSITAIYSICLFFVIASVSTGSCPAGNIKWKSVPLRSKEQQAAGLAGGEGFQDAYAIAYAPSNPSTVYLGTDTSQVWKSVDGGSSWVPKNNGFLSYGARSIAVDPINDNIVFAAGFVGHTYSVAQRYKGRLQGIYRSVDGGENWSLVRLTEFFAQESRSGCLLAFDSSTGNGARTQVIFAGSYSEGLLRSDDGGATWKPAGFKGDRITDMKEKPDNPGELLIATEEGLYACHKGEKRKVGNGLPSRPRSIAISRRNPRIVFAAVGTAGIFKSMDGGEHFERLNTGLLDLKNYTDVAVSPVDGSIAYAIADRSGTRPFFTANGGITWSTSKDPIQYLADADFWFSSPVTPHPRESKTALTVSNGRPRILKTTDGGRNWHYCGNGFTGGRMLDMGVDGNRMLFLLTDFGAWLTEDNEKTFRDLKVKRVFGLTSSSSGAIKDNTIVVSVGTWGKKALEVSQDLGKTWTVFSNAIDLFKFISFHPKRPQLIYAGPYRSRDRGRTWERMSQTIRAVYADDGDIVYAISDAADRKCRIMKSIDQGSTWQNPYPQLAFPSSSVNGMAVAPNDQDRVYLATDRGVVFFNGKTWIRRDQNHGLTKDHFEMCCISAIATDPGNSEVIYAGRSAPGYGESNGVFRSSDGGLTWENISANLGNGITIWSIRVNRFNGAVYVGTSLGTWTYSPEKRTASRAFKP